jgi:hypothetical protein
VFTGKANGIEDMQLGRPLNKGKGDGSGKEGGHEQVLSQATAVLVSLSTLITPEIIRMGLLAIAFTQRLTFASSSHAGLVEARGFLIVQVVILVVLDCTFIPLHFAARH